MGRWMREEREEEMGKDDVEGEEESGKALAAASGQNMVATVRGGTRLAEGHSSGNRPSLFVCRPSSSVSTSTSSQLQESFLSRKRNTTKGRGRDPERLSPMSRKSEEGVRRRQKRRAASSSRLALGVTFLRSSFSFLFCSISSFCITKMEEKWSRSFFVEKELLCVPSNVAFAS